MSCTEIQHKEAMDYSGCLVADDGSHLLNQLTLEEKDSNGKLRDQGRLLLKQAHNYCEQNQGRYKHQIYYLHLSYTFHNSFTNPPNIY